MPEGHGFMFSDCVLRSMATMAPERLTPVLPDRDELDDNRGNSEGWIVIAYNNDFNTWDEVVHILCRATSCTPEEANIETWEVDNLGKSVVHHGSQEECQRAANTIRTIGMRVEVMEE